MSDDMNEQPTGQDQHLADEISAHYHPIAMTLFGLLDAEDQIDQPESQAVDAAQIAEVSVVAAALRIWHWVASGPNAQRPAAEIVSQKQAVDYALQVAKGLSAAHEQLLARRGRYAGLYETQFGEEAVAA